MTELAALADRFARAQEFTSSPLYQALARIVAGDPVLLGLAARAPRGQQPTFLLFGAIHALLLGGAEHELAGFYPSIVGKSAARPPADAGPALMSFGRTYAAEIAEIVETRLVQTNNVKRSLALRLGLACVARRLAPGEPVHLVEVGASAGIHLRCDRYGYRLGGRTFGDPTSPVQVDSRWRSQRAVPDLDVVPPLCHVIGIDLHPLDATDGGDKRWLEALVWPENTHEQELLRRALTVVAADPPVIRAGDAVDLCHEVAADLPAGAPRVVFEAATRMHVPVVERPSFDAAIAALGETAPLYTVSLDGPLTVRGPGGETLADARVDGHLEWVEPRAM